ncbi:uncharacterized protein EV422DRAFT_596713 [Fimicolochytrium jonesii]|uniref:uncharacterized protein n=1 Tax=Fimicolochytrium jonesii TaxID=1396493 RepID=UPI0022FEFFA9|nr:uncharacterized protein EV422DRAFT_596713 [Fimicolochytrium jonesii]KAI8820518.1 hypothetical protein EV422DRAFT_596713 [Fimicolochytrium jonesii]
MQNHGQPRSEPSSNKPSALTNLGRLPREAPVEDEADDEAAGGGGATTVTVWPVPLAAQVVPEAAGVVDEAAAAVERVAGETAMAVERVVRRAAKVVPEAAGVVGKAAAAVGWVAGETATAVERVAGKMATPVERVVQQASKAGLGHSSGMNNKPSDPVSTLVTEGDLACSKRVLLTGAGRAIVTEGGDNRLGMLPSPVQTSDAPPHHPEAPGSSPHKKAITILIDGGTHAALSTTATCQDDYGGATLLSRTFGIFIRG